MISPGTPCVISGRDAVFPLTLCWTYRGFVKHGISMQFIAIPRVGYRTFVIPEAALIPLAVRGAELRLQRRARCPADLSNQALRQLASVAADLYWQPIAALARCNHTLGK